MSKVTMNRSVSIAGGETFSRGQEADVDPLIARAWIAGGVAEAIDGENYDDENGDGLDDLGVKELRAKAKDLDVSAGGKKEELIERIRAKLAEEPTDDDDEEVDEELAAFLDRDADDVIADIESLTDEDRAAAIEAEEADKNRDDVLAALRDGQEPSED